MGTEGTWMPKTVGVVVCTKDRPFRVAQFVDNLLELATGPGLLLLVDSTSTESGFLQNEKACTRMRSEGWDVVHIQDNPGLPHQRNSGLDYLQKERSDVTIACFLDDDIRLNRDYFQNVEKLFQRNPSLVVVGGFDLTASILRKKPLTLFVKLGLLPSAPGLIAKSGLATVPLPRTALEFVDFVPGGMQSINLQKLGNYRFDEASQFFGEDLDMHFRLAAVGRIGASNMLAVEHLEATEGKEDNGKQTFNEHIVRYRLHRSDPHRVKFLPMIVGDFMVLASDLIKSAKKFEVIQFFQILISHLAGIAIVIARKIRDAPSRGESKH